MGEERSLSCFFAREFLPLYIEKKLDSRRELQIQKHLRLCHECSAIYDHMLKTKEVLSSLSEVQVSPELVSYLQTEHRFWKQLAANFKKWKEWPSPVKWAVQLVSLSAVLVVALHFIPWLELATIARDYRAKGRAQLIFPQGASVPVAMTSPTPDSAVPMVSPTEKALPEKEFSVKAPPEKAPPEKAPLASPVVASPPATPAPTPEIVAKQEDTTKAEEDATDSSNSAALTQPQQTGYVWRGKLQVEELNQDVVDRVTKIATELGATKAGQVELGWHRGSERYYHFILPEENYEKLQSLLNQEGLLKLTKERHPRIMRNGYMRIIMTVEESTPKDATGVSSQKENSNRDSSAGDSSSGDSSN